MITIHKYQFKIQDTFTIPMPENAKIITVQLQAGIPTLWAIVDTSQPVVQRLFKIVGTGEELNGMVWYDTHLGTIQLNGFVWHVFV